MCVLRVYGPEFDPEGYLAAGSRLEALHVFVPGERTYDRRLAKEGHADRGFVVDVSRREFSDLPGQIEDATAFLREHEEELRALRSLPDVTCLELDFPSESDPETRNVIIWGGILPVSFLRAAADAGVDVEVTVYFAGRSSEQGQASPPPPAQRPR